MLPNIFICGQSGSGKSSSLRNLDPEKTIIINTERKALPFPDAAKFKKHKYISNYPHFKKALKAAIESATAEYIVIDSFSALTDLIYQHVIRYEEDDTRSAWNAYRNEIYDILTYGVSPDKYVIWLGAEDVFTDDAMRRIKTIAVQGSWQGKVESKFLIVFWAVFHEGEYKFLTNSDGKCTAKSPYKMFPSLHIDNDLAAAIDSIKNYYQ